MSTNDQEFADIRAYTDMDLPHVLPLLRKDSALLNALASYRLTWLHRIFPLLARQVLRTVLEYKLLGIQTIYEFQRCITGYYFFHMLENSVENIEITGLSHLPKKAGALLLSNHRDIVMDPTFVDYALYTKRQTTARLATGDNLMRIPFAHHLMRLNKSFWVKREATSPRDHLKNLQTLSRYIRLSITEDNELVWLAQREGRAKDGVDATDPAVLKMLALANRRSSWKQTTKALHLIPVSISYEYDPCDHAKASELIALEETGLHAKDDTASVIRSITHNKGRVAIHFSEPIAGAKDFDSEQHLAQEIDSSIICGCRIFASHLSALRMLADEQGREFAQANAWFIAMATENTHLRSEMAKVSDQRFVARLPSDQPQIRQKMLESYANPCVRYWQLCQSDKTTPANAQSKISSTS